METEDTITYIDTISIQCRLGQCVLFLGPDLLTDKNGLPVYREFSYSLYEELQDLAKKKKAAFAFDEDRKGDLTYTAERFINETNRLSGHRAVDDLILKNRLSQHISDNAVAGRMYEQLSKLPFYLIINAGFDKLIPGLIAANRADDQVTHSFAWYNNYKGRNETETGLPDQIDYFNNIVYNVFGYMGEKKAKRDPIFTGCESIILKEMEFIDYSRNINRTENGVPNIVTNFLNKDKTYLFLGYQYDDWHLKILLKALGFPKETKEKSSYSLWNHTRFSSYRHFYEDEMKFLFIPQNPEGFVDDLYRGCFGEEEEPKHQVLPKVKRTTNIVYIYDQTVEKETAFDEAVKERISGQLKDLEMSGKISQWSEDLLKPTDVRSEVIRKRYSEADIFILLLGVTLVDSMYYDRVDMAIKAVSSKPSARIIPVYLRHLSLTAIAGIPKTEWLPRDARGLPVPVRSGTEDDQDKKIKDICDYIITQTQIADNG